MVEEVKPPEAWQILAHEPRAVLLDVRSRVEFDYVGHPPNAVNIPWKEPPDWKADSRFVDKVRSALRSMYPDLEHIDAVPILALCRSGQRSRSAGEALQAGGFTRVYNITEGFEGERDQDQHRNTINGWRVHGLPWVQT